MNTWKIIPEILSRYKCLVLFAFFGILFSFQVSAQSSNKNQNLYKIWINAGSSKVEPQYLYQLADSSIFFAPTPMANIGTLVEYPIPKVYSIKVRRKGSAIGGAFLGAAAAFFANGLVDLLKQRPTQSACSVCPLLTELETHRGRNQRRYIGSVLAGGLVGGVIASIKINISIGGSYDRYEYHRKELAKYRLY